MSKQRKNLTMQDKILIFKKFGIILTATTFLTASGLNICAKVIKDNPYDGSTITTLSNRYRKSKSKSFLDEEGLIPAFINIEKLSKKEQDAYLLYYSLISNYKITQDVKKEVKNYINYAVDNPYIDYGYIYGEFQKIISKKVYGFNESNVLGTYSHDDHMLKYKEINVSFHELLHADSKDTMSSWFEEGLTALIDDEYNNCNYPRTYPLQKNVIRILCEIIGKEKARNIIFMCEKEGNIELIKEELYRLNLNGNEVNELFDKLDTYHRLTKNYNPSLQEVEKMEKDIKSTLAHFYIETHGEEKPYEYLIDYLYYDLVDLSVDKIYYLNSNEIKANKNMSYTQRYYYPYDEVEDVFDQIEELRSSQDHSRYYSNFLMNIDDKFYFQISEEELNLSDIIEPDKVILKVNKYEKGKTITECMKHENGRFVTYSSEEKEINNKDIMMLANNYNESIQNKGGKTNG